MNRMLHLLVCAALISGTVPAFAAAGGGPPDGAPYRITELFPGGDVLRPGARSDGYTWYFGFDVGPTYSSFMGGPLNFFTPMTGSDLVDGTLESTVDGGSGVGFYVGLTADFPVSDAIGIVLKGNFHNRFGSFGNDQEVRNLFISEFNEYRDVVFSDDVDWSFRYFGFDILGRFQLAEDSWYLLVGPSFGVLLGNTAEVTQNIASPDDVYYREIDGRTDNQLTTVYGDDEIEGFESLRVDLKFGVGTWIEIMDKLYLTPEITLAYPLTGIVTTSFEDFRPVIYEGSKVFSRTIAYSDFQEPVEYLDTNGDFNMITIFFTVGLRWQID